MEERRLRRREERRASDHQVSRVGRSFKRCATRRIAVRQRAQVPVGRLQRPSAVLGHRAAASRRVGHLQSYTQDSCRSRSAADSTMLRTMKRFTALSFGTRAPLDSQNTRLTCREGGGVRQGSAATVRTACRAAAAACGREAATTRTLDVRFAAARGSAVRLRPKHWCYSSPHAASRGHGHAHVRARQPACCVLNCAASSAWCVETGSTRGLSLNWAPDPGSPCHRLWAMS